MSDEPAADAVPETPTPKVEIDPAKAMQDLRALFDTLEPPDRITINDILGNSYSVRGVLPARAQIIVVQHLQRLWDNEVSTAALTSGDAATIAGVVMQLAINEGVLDGLSEAFAVAHPGAVEGARQAAKADGLDSTHPADLFAIEEMVAGLVPFFVRFVARAAGLVSAVIPTPTPTA